MAHDYYIRPMRVEDVPAVEQVTADGFYDLDVRTRRHHWPAPSRRSAERAVGWVTRMEHLVAHDPGGCFVAEDSSGIIGAAASTKRELTWALSTYAVRPDVQGRGVGKQLLDAAHAYGRGCLRGMIFASEDPLAARRYRLAGFTLHPTMVLWGQIPRSVLPVVERVREGSSADVDLMDSVDRQVRGSAHGVDHRIMLAQHRLVVVDRATGSGYAYLEPGGGPYLLAATNRRTAADLFWETLAASSPDEPCGVGGLTAANEWAVDIGMAARMELHPRNYLALQGMRPPAPYLPSGHFL